VDYDLIVTKLLDTFEWDAVILGVEGSIEPNESSWIWESSGALHLWNPYQDSPATEWERRINVLLALGRSQWNFEQARSYYLEFQRIIARELPVIQIMIPAELYGYRRGYGNVIPRPVTYNALGLVPYLFKNRASR
jgi:peptide/nickel transport system substrate-binding protein